MGDLLMHTDFVKGYKDARYAKKYDNPYKHLVDKKDYKREDAYNYMRYHNGHNTGSWDSRITENNKDQASEYYDLIIV